MDYGCSMFTDEGPVYQQLAARISDDIVAGTYPEESAVPSATDFSVFFQMNPATASKGVNLLVDLGVLYKKRGIGMFVATGARDLLRARRREQFRAQYVEPMLREADVLGIDATEVRSMIPEKREDQ